ncbi:MAG: type II secretion system protein GspM [Burkholderiaceae bacterium]
MKPYWQKLSTRIDAMSLRERVLIFLMAAVILLVLLNLLLLDPQFTRQKQLSQRITGEQAQIAAIQAEIQQKVRAQADDPDAVPRQQLEQARRRAAQLRGALQQTQEALVAPEKMPALLEAILKRDGRLQLVSLKTLPVSDLAPAPAADKKAEDAAAPAAATAPMADGAVPAASAADAGIGTVYRHGVEITVAGSYPDMMRYMAELEAMPWQLYWGKAQLRVESWPQARLTLTLFTLSLDKKWMNL